MMKLSPPSFLLLCSLLFLLHFTAVAQSSPHVVDKCPSMNTFDTCNQLLSANCSWCSERGMNTTNGNCFNTTLATCCGEFGDDCYYPRVCNTTTTNCCLPYYECEYAGNPTCCPKATSCCAARHVAICCESDTETCCSPNTMYATCCPTGSVCCGTVQSYDAIWCCPAGSQCSTTTFKCD